ncbi:hypothetical protein B0H14DRAFT_3530594 [Mycena olivaceomarginata]|nr:hypothetical protein B0H14DRAFT_3530594 [Mycena olivaceomarginata]
MSVADLGALSSADQYDLGERIFVGLKDYVFDVSVLREFLGPMGQSSAYAAKDISYALTKCSNQTEDTNVVGYNTLSVPELKILDRWFSMFLCV